MIKQVFDVDKYWKVIVFYSLDYNFFDNVALELIRINYSEAAIEEVYDNLRFKGAKAVTCSSPHQHTSIILFNYHKSKLDYINSIVHEAEHVKQAMLFAYEVEDKGEPPAYTIGYIVERMWEVVGKKLLDCF